MPRSTPALAADTPVQSAGAAFLVSSIAFSIPVIAFVVALLRLRTGWDDGAITAAFAQTYARCGRYALTPVSAQVEGFSSLLWMHLLALPFHLLHPTPLALLVWMKLLSALSFMAALSVMRAWLIAAAVDTELQGWMLLLLACLKTLSIEVINGMEMNLCLLVTMGITWALWKDTKGSRWAIALLTGCLLATRFEALYTVVLLAAASMATFADRRRIVLLGASSAAWFSIFALWRYRTFHLWMPNTIYAKRWPPYRLPGLKAMIETRIVAEAELVAIAVVLILVALVLLSQKRRPLQALIGSSIFRFSATMLAGAVIFQAILGKNWGHVARMVEQYLPFMIVVLALVIDSQILRQNRAGVFRRLAWAQVLTSVLLIYIGDRHPTPVLEPESQAMAVERIRRIIGSSRISYLTPDIGGAGLCCEHLEIRDSALLVNPDLARSGWKGFPAYLASTRPEVIETHSPWSELSGIYASSGVSDYSLAWVSHHRLLVRNDLWGLLQQSGAVLPVAQAGDCRGSKPADQAFSDSRGICLSLP